MSCLYVVIADCNWNTFFVQNLLCPQVIYNVVDEKILVFFLMRHGSTHELGQQMVSRAGISVNVNPTQINNADSFDLDEQYAKYQFHISNNFSNQM